jgi:hypothetical protein
MPEIFKDYIEIKLAEQKDDARAFIRELVKEENLDLAIEIHNKYIRAMPESLSVFSKLVLDAAAREEIRSYFSLIVAYIIEPDNFLRKNVPDAIGLFDSAHVVHASLEIALKTLDEQKKAELSEEIEHLKPIFELNSVVRSRIPEHILKRQEVIINYLEKLLDVKASLKERTIYIMPPK